ncbi:MAG: hypothetical protein BWZ10_00684 [candidate division BRC1 bacterium ADurb.BinA364]|nr:MAG: hypothetical protein BWZ10_00684 [candidate division BRC1 bacterium ADurb.BinA364]
MHTHALDRGAAAGVEQGEELMDVAVDVAVGKQADEMNRSAGARALDDLLPGGAFFQRAAFQGMIDELGALGKNTAGAKRVVADFGVAHVVIRRQPDGRAVRLELRIQRLVHQRVERGRIGLEHAVRLVAGAEADAVENRQHQGSRKRVVPGRFAQCHIGHEIGPFLAWR